MSNPLIIPLAAEPNVTNEGQIIDGTAGKAHHTGDSSADGIRGFFDGAGAAGGIVDKLGAQPNEDDEEFDDEEELEDEPEEEPEDEPEKQREPDERDKLLAEKEERLKALQIERDMAARASGDIWAGYPEDVKQYLVDEVTPHASKYVEELKSSFENSFVEYMKNSPLLALQKEASEYFADEDNAKIFVESFNDMLHHIQNLVGHYSTAAGRGIGAFTHAAAEMAYKMKSGDAPKVSDAIPQNGLEDAFVGLASQQKYANLDKQTLKSAWTIANTLMSKGKLSAKEAAAEALNSLEEGSKLSRAKKDALRQQRQAYSNGRQRAPREKGEADANTPLESIAKNFFS